MCVTCLAQDTLIISQNSWELLDAQEGLFDISQEYGKIPVNKKVRGMVKNLLLLGRVGSSGRHWVHAVMCDNTNSDICMILHGDSCFNLVKSENRYRLHMTICRTTRAYHGTMVAKRLFITCPSANIIWIKDKLILRVNDWGIYCQK